jgi:hypothetical protein
MDMRDVKLIGMLAHPLGAQHCGGPPLVRLRTRHRRWRIRQTCHSVIGPTQVAYIHVSARDRGDDDRPGLARPLSWSGDTACHTALAIHRAGGILT